MNQLSSRHTDQASMTDLDTGEGKTVVERADPDAPKADDTRPRWDFEVKLTTGKVVVNEIAAATEADARVQLASRYPGATILSVEPG